MQKEEWNKRKSSLRSSPFRLCRQRHHNKSKDVKDNKGWKGTEKDSIMTEEVAARAKAQKETAHALKEEKRIALAKKLVDRYNCDPF